MQVIPIKSNPMLFKMSCAMFIQLYILESETKSPLTIKFKNRIDVNIIEDKQERIK